MHFSISFGQRGCVFDHLGEVVTQTFFELTSKSFADRLMSARNTNAFSCAAVSLACHFFFSCLLMTLVERFGGEPAIDEFVSIFYQMMKDDQQLGKSFQRFNFELLKDRTVDFFLADWAGETWEGRPLFQAHASLHITVEMYDVMMKCIRKTLKQMKKSKQVSDEVVEAVERLREPICDPLWQAHGGLQKEVGGHGGA